MNLDQAHQILGLSTGATKEEAKKAFKKLAAKYHPDVNKEANAESKFKELNEALRTIENPPKVNEIPFNPFNDQPHWDSGGISWQDIGISSVRKKTVTRQPVKINIELDFIEAVLGCKKSLKFTRYEKCKGCQGAGGTYSTDKCTVCGGKGKSIRQENKYVFMTECGSCNGIGKLFNDCVTCSGECSTAVDKSFEVNLPGALHNNSTVRLAGAGHYVGDSGFFAGYSSEYSDAFITVKVKSHPSMKLEGDNVISSISISLLEALQGVSKEVLTVKGTQFVDIPARSRHRDQITLQGFGAPGGHHLINLEVEYPQDTNKLVEQLKIGE